MKNISPYRIIGRANAVCQHLLAKYQLAATDSSADTVMLLLALEQRVQGNDKILCHNIALAAHQSGIVIENLKLSAYKDLDEFVEAETEGLDEIIDGKTEALYIINKYRSDSATRITEDYDFLPEMKAAQEAKKRRNKLILRIALASLGVLVLTLIIYNLPYFAEKRAFADVEKTISEGSYYAYDVTVEHYNLHYPDGAHVEEVHVLPVRSCRELDQPIYTIKSAEKYLNRFPDGKYADEVNEIYNSVWNDEIARFNELAADKASVEGAEFVRRMLEYMKEKRVSTVAVTGNPTLDLKEYSEYPEYIRKILEMETNKFTMTKLPEDMITIKDKITMSKALSWTHIITQALQKGFDNVLTKGFITFVSQHEASPGSPEVNVNYTVSTQETSLGSVSFPDIWTYTSKVNGLTMSSKYVLGIGMTFDAVFTLPDSDFTYAIQSAGDAGTEDIQADTSVAYNIMCERCTERFSEKIASEFGI